MLEEFLRSADDEFYEGEYAESQLGSQVLHPSQLPDAMEDIAIAIVGVKEDRGSKNNVGSAAAPDEIRRQLYMLSKLNREMKIADLGNIEGGASLKDSYVALSHVVNEMLRLKVIPVIIGGSHDLTFGQYGGYHEIGRDINVSVVDSMIDFYDGVEEINDENFLGRVFVAEPSVLHNTAVIAYQTHLVTPKSLEVMDKLHFENYRLGRVRADMNEVEPVFRYSNLCSFDLSAVRFADSPANYTASPNGLFGEEMCQLARFAGQSDSVDSFGLYGCNLAYDSRDQTVKLAAQVIWYFLDGVVNRRNDFPNGQDENYTKYTVQFKENKYEMNFWKSRKSDRWWMEVPTPEARRNQKKSHLVPCSYTDYQMACREEIPERWMKAMSKLA
jgi:arginase family enzyme